MRILVATDAIGPLPSRQAGELIASRWRPSADVSVLPVGEAGDGFIAAYADLARCDDLNRAGGRMGLSSRPALGPIPVWFRCSDSVHGTGIPFERTSRPIGRGHCAGGSPASAGTTCCGLWQACGSMTPEPVCWPRSAQAEIARSIEVSTASTGSVELILRQPERCWVRRS